MKYLYIFREHMFDQYKKADVTDESLQVLTHDLGCIKFPIHLSVSSGLKYNHMFSGKCLLILSFKNIFWPKFKLTDDWTNMNI